MPEKYLCGVPEIHCRGGLTQTDQVLSATQKGKRKKMHESRKAAFKCYTNYLVKILGFTRVGNREFINPKNGYVRLVTRVSKFGAECRPGKGEGESRSRYMPKRGRGAIIG